MKFFSRKNPENTPLLSGNSNTPSTSGAFEVVPLEVFEKIGFYLNDKEFARLSQTNKNINAMVMDSRTSHTITGTDEEGNQIKRLATFAEIIPFGVKRADYQQRMKAVKPSLLTKGTVVVYEKVNDCCICGMDHDFCASLGAGIGIGVGATFGTAGAIIGMLGFLPGFFLCKGASYVAQNTLKNCVNKQEDEVKNIQSELENEIPRSLLMTM